MKTAMLMEVLGVCICLKKEKNDMIMRDTVVKSGSGRHQREYEAYSRIMRQRLAIMPVVKANGYGHGAVGIAPALMEEGAAYLAVATLTEAP